MKRKLPFFLAALVVMTSFFVFQSLDSKDSSIPASLQTPSMIPGAEAMRPLAAQQSGRVDAFVSEMTAPEAVSAEPAPVTSVE